MSAAPEETMVAPDASTTIHARKGPLMPEDAEFTAAKAFLQTYSSKSQTSLYTHLTDILTHVLQTKQSNAVGRSSGRWGVDVAVGSRIGIASRLSTREHTPLPPPPPGRRRARVPVGQPEEGQVPARGCPHLRPRDRRRAGRGGLLSLPPPPCSSAKGR
jgi:hypothetical protein